MATGTCYTWSGDKKIYEPDLFKAQLMVGRTEYCFRYDSANSKTLVFGRVPEQGFSYENNAYLPCFDLSINHNIQANGEDHYNLSGTYTGPNYNWSPPAGVDGPFYDYLYLKYPYYEYSFYRGHTIFTWYGDRRQMIKGSAGGKSVRYYGNKK